ncbi:MAG: NUDIX hydrolase [Faecalibacterium sp.]|nr:NUDIX hydrolase [Faecalibacterium sp.]
MAEQVLLYNRMRRPLDRTHPLDQPLPKGTYRVVVSGWVESEKGAFLMTRLPDGDAPNAGLWQPVTGNVLEGETSLSAVLRTASAALGLEAEPKKVKLHSAERVDRCQSFHDVFRIKATKKLEELTVDTTLLAEARWMMPAEIEQLARQKKLSPLARNYDDIIFPE